MMLKRVLPAMLMALLIGGCGGGGGGGGGGDDDSAADGGETTTETADTGSDSDSGTVTPSTTEDPLTPREQFVTSMVDGNNFNMWTCEFDEQDLSDYAVILVLLEDGKSSYALLEKGTELTVVEEYSGDWQVDEDELLLSFDELNAGVYAYDYEFYSDRLWGATMYWWEGEQRTTEYGIVCEYTTNEFEPVER